MKGAIVPLTAAAYEDLTGKAPQKSMRGYALEVNGEPLSMFGLYYDATDRLVVFCDAKPAFRATLSSTSSRKLVVRAARAMLALIATTRGPVHADADQNIEAAERLLEHMGFVRLEGRVFSFPR